MIPPSNPADDSDPADDSSASAQPSYSQRPYPQPPYSDDLLADLHAGLLPAEVDEHVRAHLTDRDRAILAALDQTMADLRRAPIEDVPIPDHVRAMTERTLAAISAEVASSRPAAAPFASAPAARPTVSPARTAPAAPTDLADRRRHRGQWIAGGAGLLATAAIAAVVALSFSVWNTPNSDDQPAQAQPSTDAGISTSDAGANLSGADRVAMLSVFGRTDAAPFGSIERLRRCTAANGVADDVPVVGSGPVTLSGRPAAVILLGSGVAGRFTALAVGLDCDTDRPSTISRTELGR